VEAVQVALLSHVGVGSADLGAINTVRADISDLLLASLMPENNLLGNFPVGSEFADPTARWVEDRLNANTVTDTTGGGQSTSSTTLNVSAADQAILMIGWVLVDEVTLGTLNAEQVQITAFPASGQVTITRGYGLTTAVTHAQNAVWRVVNSPTYEGSDLGPDMSRARIAKSNVVTRYDINVIITQEQIIRANSGYAPGVRDELKYQFQQRVAELKKRMNNALLMSRQAASGTSSDYATMAGVIAMLDGTWNATAQPQNQSGAAFSDTMLNSANALLDRQGAVPDQWWAGVNVTRAAARIYSDRVRVEQSDETRGFKVSTLDTDLRNSLRLLKDNAIYDTSPNGLGLLLDSSRWRLRPYRDSFFYVITAPSFRDADAMRALTKFSLEGRNTGTDIGYASLLLYGIAS
jgi:hypothetical protein